MRTEMASPQGNAREATIPCHSRQHTQTVGELSTGASMGEPDQFPDGNLEGSGTASMEDPRIIEINDGVHNVRGVDCIWHNMYADSTFTTFRWIPGDVDIDTMIVRVARHVKQGIYSIISLNASKHSLTVVCVCEKNWEDLPRGWYCDDL